MERNDKWLTYSSICIPIKVILPNVLSELLHLLVLLRLRTRDMTFLLENSTLVVLHWSGMLKKGLKKAMYTHKTNKYDESSGGLKNNFM